MLLRLEPVGEGQDHDHDRDRDDASRRSNGLIGFPSGAHLAHALLRRHRHLLVGPGERELQPLDLRCVELTLRESQSATTVIEF